MTNLKIGLRSQRIMLWISLLMAGIYGYAFIFLMNFIPPPSPTLTAEQVVALYADHNMQFRVGVVLMIATGGFFSLQSVVILTQLARDERGMPIWQRLFALTSPFQTLALSFTPILFGVAAFSVDRAPGLTLLMHEFAWLFYVTPISWWPLVSIPIIVISLSKKRDPDNSAFPRWIGWLTFFFMVITDFGVVAMLLKTGPFAWDGFFAFYLPFGFYGIWMGAVVYSLFRAIRRQENALIRQS